MINVNLFDSEFIHTEKLLGYITCSDRLKPTKINWINGQHKFDGITIFTENYINSDLVDSVQSNIKILWLLEPRVIHPNPYIDILKLEHKFDYILTYDTELLSRGEKYLKYVVGQSRVPLTDSMIYDKNKLVSMIASNKRISVGHRFRHDIANALAIDKHIDLWGSAYKPFSSKLEPLKDYHFSVSVMNSKVDNFFTEVLIDNFMVGTIPIFWGCPNIGDYFDINGIITFDTIDELDDILQTLTGHYSRRFKKNNNMKILVLGSDGQIGLALVKHLKKNNHEVIEFDIASNNNNDLRIPNILDTILPTIDFVFFLAFDVGGSTYLNKYQHTYEYLDNNVKLMSNTFDMLKKHKTKFLFTSTQMSNMIYSPYGVLKKLGETYTEVLNGVCVKCWNVYGVEHDLNKAHVITDFILMAKDNNQIEMKTNGTELRQFLYVDDCCECLSTLMSQYDNIDRTKNLHITNFKWDNIKTIAEIVSKEFNNCKIIESELFDKVQLDKRNEPDEYILSFWSPKTTLKNGIIKIINNYK